MIVAGVGCRAECPAEEITLLVRRAEAISGARVGALAAPGFKFGTSSPAEAATALALPLIWIEEDALRAVQPACITRSAAAVRHTGLASVAEAAALAAAGPGATLHLPSIASASATCAIAESPSP